jgi:hypothetical protein
MAVLEKTRGIFAIYDESTARAGIYSNYERGLFVLGFNAVRLQDRRYRQTGIFTDPPSTSKRIFKSYKRRLCMNTQIKNVILMIAAIPVLIGKFRTAPGISD